MTGGLLVLAIRACVMLRRNIDTKLGLVNGSLGTVTAVTKQFVTVQFDHLTNPYKVERVKSRFVVMKNYYVRREQFPLILAYAVTIHKSQGLSLDHAIIDLSDKVFNRSLEEYNRLRKAYRPDLPQYTISVQRLPKRKLVGKTESDHVDTVVPAKKRKCTSKTQSPSTQQHLLAPRVLSANELALSLLRLQNQQNGPVVVILSVPLPSSCIHQLLAHTMVIA